MVFTQSYPEYMKRSAPVARALQAFEAENASGVRATLSWFVCCSFDVGLLLSAFVCVCVEAPCVRGICVSTVFSLQSGACGFALAGCVFLRIGFVDCRDQQSAVSYVKSDEQVCPRSLKSIDVTVRSVILLLLAGCVDVWNVVACRDRSRTRIDTTTTLWYDRLAAFVLGLLSLRTSWHAGWNYFFQGRSRDRDPGTLRLIL
jgi:hypothetical protein